MRILESERILLKPVEPEDLSFLLDLRWDIDIMAYQVHDPISLKSQQAWYENLSKSGNLALSVFEKNTDRPQEKKLAGTIGLMNINHRHQRATWTLRLDQAFQGRGIAYEASMLMLDYGFNTLNLNKVFSDSFPDNAPIIKLLTKLRFTQEGLMKAHYYHNGEFKDSAIYAMLRADFNRLKA